jgi:hypothetical protein
MRSSRLVDLICVVVVLFCTVRSAHADDCSANKRGKFKVKIDSAPQGALIYINTKECPSIGVTPWEGELDAGDFTILLEAPGYAPASKLFEIAMIQQTQELFVPLVKQQAPPKFDGPDVGGADAGKAPPEKTIQIEREEQGKAPTPLELGGGRYHVVITLDGKPMFDDFVEVEPTQDGTVATTTETTTKHPTPDRTDTERTITEPVPNRAHSPCVIASGAFDVGFRRFTYDGNMTPNTLRQEAEGGQVLAGPMLELWPTEILGLHGLRGLSLLARFERGVNAQAVTGEGIVGTTTTFWQSVEVSLRDRWIIGGNRLVEVGGGYLRDTFRFNGTANDILLLPDADYQSLRVGVRGALLVGAFEPYVVFEDRIVLDGGALGKRFALGASANGLHAALGVAAHAGHLGARLEAAITDYSWSFKPQTGAMFVASGGSDLITQISLSLGYSY